MVDRVENPHEADVAVFEELSAATAGLTYASESDEPIRPFTYKQSEADAAAQLAALGKPTTPLRETSLAAFFQPLLNNDPDGRFAALQGAVMARLTHVRVLRVGRVEVDIYVIGKTLAGNWAGVQTLSVET